MLFTDELEDFVDLTDPSDAAYSELLYESIDVSYTSTGGWGAVAVDTIGTSDVPTYYYIRCPVLTDSVRVGDVFASSTKYAVVVVERGGVRDVLLVAVPVNVSETVGIAQVVATVRAFTVIERLGLSDAVGVQSTLGKIVSEGIGIADSLRNFFSGDVVEGIAVSDVATRQRVLNPTLTDTTGINDALTKKLVLRVIAAETVQLTPTEALKMLFRPTLTDGVELAAAYISPGDSVTTWAVNTKNMATTEYTNYVFNSFAQMGNKYLGATSGGLYELNGDDDQGTDIIADIKSGLMQLGGSRFTSFKSAYLGMRGEGSFVLKVETGDGKVYNYAVVGKDMQTSRVHFGKGLRARYFSFELISTGQDFDLDNIEFIPLVVQRRV